MDAALQQLYFDVFGSDSDTDEYSSHTQFRASCKPEDRPPDLPGLTLQKGALTMLQQEALFKTLEQTYFREPAANQAMCFGSLPFWGAELVSTLQRQSLLLPVPRRQPLFDQLAVNRYEPGEGLKAHVDLPHRFDDGIAIISLGAPAVMRFTAPPAAAGTGAADSPSAAPCCSAPAPAPGALLASVLLEPGDCLLLCGTARYNALHGFDAAVEEQHEGRRITRGVRTSVTLRRLL